MINFKFFKLESLGPLVLLGSALLVLVGVVHLVLQVLLNIGFPGAMGPVSLTDTLLFLLLLAQVHAITGDGNKTKKK
jgi:hypothetical protein